MRRRAGSRPGRFSFNVKGGRCEACQGDGVIAIEMHFLPDVYVTCEQCKGRRYNRETLEIKYRGKSIADVLELTVDQALPLMENLPAIANKLRTLQSVGLGYVALGQSATTLSGGEAQRVKLAKELSKRGTGRTLYILDEPTTGLHFEDTRKLLDVLTKLVDQGNTIVVIEHNLDVIKSADYVIDLGPEGGVGGGRIVAAGTPEEVAQTMLSRRPDVSSSTCSATNSNVRYVHWQGDRCGKTGHNFGGNGCGPRTTKVRSPERVRPCRRPLSCQKTKDISETHCELVLRASSLLSCL